MWSKYLERRFHVSVRKMASLILIFQMVKQVTVTLLSQKIRLTYWITQVTYMATAVWAPALALSQGKM